MIIVVYTDLVYINYITERTKKVLIKQEDYEKNDEEEWSLKDVIFIEDTKNFPVGKFRFH